jgi:hypothetical protein
MSSLARHTVYTPAARRGTRSSGQSANLRTGPDSSSSTATTLLAPQTKHPDREPPARQRLSQQLNLTCARQAQAHPERGGQLTGPSSERNDDARRPAAPLARALNSYFGSALGAAVDARRANSDNGDMSVANQSDFPASTLCRFLDAALPDRGVIAEEWDRQATNAPWSGVAVAGDRRGLGLAAEIRIGLDLAAVPGYRDLL